ncbi:MAG: UDP-3-O-(3-hydroxymyristoyl)glucosamine N-acyltransferase [candidate division Zixibacteria bacterium]|nr:UDP-3-O-(3-hydroxymyristoyl)glucosamine N-acyltransferase [candidate division Zixibacteria bacterium]
MRTTLAEIAAIVGGDLVGDGTVIIERVASLEDADGVSVSFLSRVRQAGRLKETRAAAAIVPHTLATAPLPIIRVRSPERAVAALLTVCLPPTPPAPPGIHPTAVISPSAVLSDDVAIGPYVVIGDRATLGSGVAIGAGTFIGADCRIDAHTWLFPRVTLYDGVCLGKWVIVHSGAVIGSDGFGYTTGEHGAVKIPQVGDVVIGNLVEIGANTTIDRATLGSTRIGDGTKIDNLVQIGHNVVIGAHVTICAQTGIAGSTVIEDGVVIAGQAGLKDHITVGAGAKIGGQAGVTKSVPPRIAVSGYPARPHEQARRIEAALVRLPGVLQRLRALERRLEPPENDGQP